MSKIYLKTNRSPFLIEKELAEKLEKQFIEKSVELDTMITIQHSQGRTSFAFGEIKQIDVTLNNNDYKTSRNEYAEKSYAPPPPPPEIQTGEDKRYFKEKSKLLKEAMGWR